MAGSRVAALAVSMEAATATDATAVVAWAEPTAAATAAVATAAAEAAVAPTVPVVMDKEGSTADRLAERMVVQSGASLESATAVAAVVGTREAVATAESRAGEPVARMVVEWAMEMEAVTAAVSRGANPAVVQGAASLGVPVTDKTAAVAAMARVVVPPVEVMVAAARKVACRYSSIRQTGNCGPC